MRDNRIPSPRPSEPRRPIPDAGTLRQLAAVWQRQTGQAIAVVAIDPEVAHPGW